MQFSFKKRQQGSVLAVTLVTCLVIATVLSSYLLLISNRYTLTVRSMDWNTAMPVAEAGLEEAMTHLQFDTNSPNANGWANRTIGGQSVPAKTRSFDDGSYADVYILNASSKNPTIYSSGFVPAPLGQGYISRTVRVETVRPSDFHAAIAASGVININPLAPIVIDSFRSGDPAYSTNGRYDPSKHLANGAVVTTSTAKPAIKLDSDTTILGELNTGAGGTIDPNGGKVGDLNWAGPGIQSGYSNADLNVSYPIPSLPSPWSTNTLTPGTYSEGGTNYTYRLGTGQHTSLSAINIGVGKSVVVTGDAVWYVQGDFQTGGTGFVYISPGASLTVYVSGKVVIGGGGVANGTGYAGNLSIKGLPGCNSVAISGNGDLIGTINAPQAVMTLSGNGNLVGACIVKTFNATGKGSVHYDEDLTGGDGLVITAWKEL